MSTPKRRSSIKKPEDAYHHGDLKRALFKAALQIVEREGHEALTLREAARRAGVSHNAPYRHYENLEALTAEVAVEGFTQLRATLIRVAEGSTDPAAQRRLLGRAWLDFAVERRRLYQLMFSPLDPKLHEDLAMAARLAFALLAAALAVEAPKGVEATRAIDEVCREGLATLASVHGLATLIHIGVVNRDDPEIDRILSGAFGPPRGAKG